MKMDDWPNLRVKHWMPIVIQDLGLDKKPKRGSSIYDLVHDTVKNAKSRQKKILQK